MIVLQYIIILLLLIAWGGALIKLRNKQIEPSEFVFWSLIWLSLIVFSIFPIIPSNVSKVLGVGRGVDLVIYGSIFLLFFMCFKIYTRLEEQDKRLTSLVRELALERKKK